MVSSLIARNGKWGTVGVSVASDRASGRGTGATGVLTVRVSFLITLLFGKNCHCVENPVRLKENKDTTASLPACSIPKRFLQ